MSIYGDEKEDRIKSAELNDYLDSFTIDEALGKDVVKEVRARIEHTMRILPGLYWQVCGDGQDFDELVEAVLQEFSDRLLGV